MSKKIKVAIQNGSSVDVAEGRAVFAGIVQDREGDMEENGDSLVVSLIGRMNLFEAAEKIGMMAGQIIQQLAAGDNEKAGMAYIYMTRKAMDNIIAVKEEDHDECGEKQ